GTEFARGDVEVVGFQQVGRGGGFEPVDELDEIDGLDENRGFVLDGVGVEGVQPFGELPSRAHEEGAAVDVDEIVGGVVGHGEGRWLRVGPKVREGWDGRGTAMRRCAGTRLSGYGFG